METQKLGMAESSIADFHSYMPLVYYLAKKMFKRSDKCELDDLIQYGCIGLLEGLSRIDTKKNPKIYIQSKIRYAILDGLRTEGMILPRSCKNKTLFYTDVLADVDPTLLDCC